MTCVIVNDASCLIDLHKGRLLTALLKLPYRFVIPLPVRESELLGFTDRDWRTLDNGGMETFDLPPKRMAEAFKIKKRYPRLSANDCSCLVSTRCHKNGVLLTGDNLLRRTAHDHGVPVHGVLWVIDELKKGKICRHDLLISALRIWRDDQAVFLPNTEIDLRLRSLQIRKSR